MARRRSSGWNGSPCACHCRRRIDVRSTVGLFFPPVPGQGRHKGKQRWESIGKLKDVKQYSSRLSRWKPTSASVVGASEARARSEAGALVVLPEPSKTERHVVGSELRILCEHEVRCARVSKPSQREGSLRRARESAWEGEERERRARNGEVCQLRQ